MGKRKHKGGDPSAKKVAVGPPSDTVIQLADLAFSKWYTYPLDSDTSLDLNTASENLFKVPQWFDSELQLLKVQLNEVKSRLTSIDINEWHDHTGQTHPGGRVVSQMRKNYNAEMCTQAWAKFREILHRLKFSDSGQLKQLNSVHLCEAPGAFITSLNHFLKDTGICSEWKWLALSLNPYYEGTHQDSMIDDDQFIYNTLQYWYFGEDDTGNIKNSKNITALVEKCRDMMPIQLVTADGGFDCSNNYGEQETMSAPLHYAEVTAALHILAPGGNFVLKMFTMFEESSIALMYLLRSCFVKLSVFKPVTSKPGNSEQYVLCEGYKPLPKAFLKSLLQHVGDNLPGDMALLPESKIAESFRTLHTQCSQRFTRYQSDAIQQNLTVWYGRVAGVGTLLQDIEGLRHYCLHEYTRRYKIQPLDTSEWIATDMLNKHKMRVPKSHDFVKHQKIVMNKFHEISRQTRLHTAWRDRVRYMDLLPKDSTTPLPWIHYIYWMESEAVCWRPVRGQGFEVTLSSRFCDNKLLQMYNEILQHAELCVTTEIIADFHTSALPALISVLEAKSILESHAVVGVPGEHTLSDLLVVHQKESTSEVSSYTSNLVVVDSYSSDSNEQWWCTGRHSLCVLVHCLCTALGEKDALLITIPPILTRLTAAMIYICQRAFKMMTLVVPDEATLPVCYLFAMGYKPLPIYMTIYLTGITCILGDDITTGTCQQQHDNQLLAIVPIPCLYEPDMQDLVWQANAKLLQRRVNSILLCEKRAIIEEQMPAEANASITGRGGSIFTDAFPELAASSGTEADSDIKMTTSNSAGNGTADSKSTADTREESSVSSADDKSQKHHTSKASTAVNKSIFEDVPRTTKSSAGALMRFSDIRSVDINEEEVDSMVSAEAMRRENQENNSDSEPEVIVLSSTDSEVDLDSDSKSDSGASDVSDSIFEAYK